MKARHRIDKLEKSYGVAEAYRLRRKKKMQNIILY